MQLKNAIGEDVRTFGSHKETLQSILKNQGADVVGIKGIFTMSNPLDSISF
jgi:hypothetical protein